MLLPTHTYTFATTHIQINNKKNRHHKDKDTCKLCCAHTSHQRNRRTNSKRLQEVYFEIDSPGAKISLTSETGPITQDIFHVYHYVTFSSLTAITAPTLKIPLEFFSINYVLNLKSGGWAGERPPGSAPGLHHFPVPLFLSLLGNREVGASSVFARARVWIVCTSLCGCVLYRMSIWVLRTRMRLRLKHLYSSLLSTFDRMNTMQCD